MTVKIATDTKCYTFNNVWELQDNEGTYIVVKFHGHECELIDRKTILDIKVEA